MHGLLTVIEQRRRCKQYVYTDKYHSVAIAKSSHYVLLCIGLEVYSFLSAAYVLVSFDYLIVSYTFISYIGH